VNKYQKYLPTKSNILVLAPHPDDEVIGCGGTLLLHKNLGSIINCVYLNRSEQSRFLTGIPLEERVKIREAEAAKVAQELGVSNTHFLCDLNFKIKDDLLKNSLAVFINKKYRPDIIFIPWYGDDHPEHVLINQYLSEIKLDMDLLKSTLVIGYEVWTPIFRPNIFSNITDVLQIKLSLLKMYHSVGGDSYYSEAIKGMNRFRSLYVYGGVGYSEAFMEMSLRDYIVAIKKSFH